MCTFPHQKHTLTSLNLLALICLNFKNQFFSIFNNLCTIGLNITKPPRCTLTNHWRLLNSTKSVVGGYLGLGDTLQNHFNPPLFNEGFPITLKVLWGTLWLGRFQNEKQTTLTNRLLTINWIIIPLHLQWMVFFSMLGGSRINFQLDFQNENQLAHYMWEPKW